MSLKSQRLCSVDNHFRGAVLVRDVDGSGAILIVQPRIGADQLTTLLVLVPPLLPPPPSALCAEDDGHSQRERGEGAGGSRRGPQPLAQDAGPFLQEFGQRILRRRPAQV